MAWWDFYKLWTYSFEPDPITRRNADKDQPTGVGSSSPEVPDIRQDGSFWGGGGGMVRLRDTTEFIDLSTVTNRQSRYKEYERLRGVAEIESAMTIIADEACVGGHTKIATVHYGHRTIEWLTENVKEPFLVYCWDFEKQDYTLGWAYEPRKVKRTKTVRVLLDDGSSFIVTPDHRVLLKNGEWKEAANLKFHDELMPFYKIEPHRMLNENKHNLFPRIFTFKKGWINERQFIDEWKTGDKPNERQQTINIACQALANDLGVAKTAELAGHAWLNIETWLNKAGWSREELKWLGRKKQQRKVVGILDWSEQDVYDLSVKDHQNFCTDSVIMHNCQLGENGHVMQVLCKNREVQKELDFLLFHRSMLNMDRRAWNMVKKLCIFGDYFGELCLNPDNPKDGILRLKELAPDSMYRLETTMGRLIEFQQSAEGPDTQCLTRPEVTQSTEQDLMQSTALRFTPNQIIHMKLGDDRKLFYPYGQSLIEPARGPAHQLRLMEDSMVVYRLVRAPERRVFYIDTMNLAPHRAEAFVERLKDQLKKKKVSKGGAPGSGASALDERFTPPSAEDDIWIPIKPNCNTRVESLPGAQNLGEIDDALYFRNKLFTALNFPRNYFANEDPSSTRITLSAQDSKFARMVERIQLSFIDGIYELCERHLELIGIPKEDYEDLIIKMTPPSDWREQSRAETISNRINIATALKSAALYSDYDILTKIMKHSEEETKDIVSRAMLQKIQDAKLQIAMANPELVGYGVPGQGENEMGIESGGPNPSLSPDGMPPPDQGGGQDMGGAMGPEAGQGMGAPQEPKKKGPSLPEIEDGDIKKYDLEIKSYDQEKDHQEIDYSEEK